MIEIITDGIFNKVIIGAIVVMPIIIFGSIIRTLYIEYGILGIIGCVLFFCILYCLGYLVEVYKK